MVTFAFEHVCTHTNGTRQRAFGIPGKGAKPFLLVITLITLAYCWGKEEGEESQLNTFPRQLTRQSVPSWTLCHLYDYFTCKKRIG